MMASPAWPLSGRHRLPANSPNCTVQPLNGVSIVTHHGQPVITRTPSWPACHHTHILMASLSSHAHPHGQPVITRTSSWPACHHTHTLMPRVDRILLALPAAAVTRADTFCITCLWSSTAFGSIYGQHSVPYCLVLSHLKPKSHRPPGQMRLFYYWQSQNTNNCRRPASPPHTHTYDSCI